MIKNKLPETNLTLDDFQYDLPEELIAQSPVEPRDSSRLMIVDRENQKISDISSFREIINYLNEGDVLVINDTRVIPARIIGKRKYRYDSSSNSKVLTNSSAPVELLLLKQLENNIWETLAGPGKRAKIGDIISFGDDLLRAEILDITENGCRKVRFSYDSENENLFSILDTLGTVPLPPYITKKLDDPERYQTVYSKIKGSAAAPTAGLHFTKDLLDLIQKKGIKIVPVLLHVGLGTFRPVKVEKITEHQMHSEYIEVTEDACNIINECKKNGGRVIAVGTTSCRTIESASDENGILYPVKTETGIFIYPGYKFKITDALITNFHLPGSTLLMLVSALAGRDLILDAYKHAVSEKYRFFSFGDAMMIL